MTEWRTRKAGTGKQKGSHFPVKQTRQTTLYQEPEMKVQKVETLRVISDKEVQQRLDKADKITRETRLPSAQELDEEIRYVEGGKKRILDYGWVDKIGSSYFGFVQGDVRPVRATEGYSTREEAEKELLQKYPDLKPALGKEFVTRPRMAISKGTRWHVTEKGDRMEFDKPFSLRNKKIIAMLKLEGASTVPEIAHRMGLRGSTTEVELEYLKNEGLVKEV